MLTKERPHLTRRVDCWLVGPTSHSAIGLPPGQMAASLDRVEHHGRVVSTVRVFAAGDIRRDRRSIGFGPHWFR